nr:hypothetical protein [Coleofasciculus sp. FACHB-125]
MQYLGNSVVYYPRVAKATGGVTASIFFCQIIHRQSQLNNPHEWTRVNFDEIEDETGLSRVEQELARSQLVGRGILKERAFRGNDDIMEFLPDINAFEKRLNEFGQEGSISSSFNPKKTIVLHQPDPSKADSKNSSNTLYSKATTETVIQSPLEVVKSSHSQAETIKVDKFFPVPRQQIAVKVTPNYQFNGPWESPEQFKEFQKALLEYFKNQGVHNPSGWVFKIVDGITKGVVSPFWDEFAAGIPFGESQKIKRDWEIEPGVPYPAFEEERIQYYIHKGEPLEVAVAKARSELRDPVVGKDLWDGFLRKCDRIADEAIKAKKLGVATPYLPPSFTDKPQITKQSVINKLAIVSSQFSLASSSSENLANLSLDQEKTERKISNPGCNIPTLDSLQKAYENLMSRTLVEKQIAEHPEWGYGIVDGQVIDLIPF